MIPTTLGIQSFKIPGQNVLVVFPVIAQYFCLFTIQRFCVEQRQIYKSVFLTNGLQNINVLAIYQLSYLALCWRSSYFVNF